MIERSRDGAVVLAASFGGIEAVQGVLSRLPAAFSAPILVVQHLSRKTYYQSDLPGVLQRQTRLRVVWCESGQEPEPGCVYVAPQDCVTTLGPEGLLRVRAAESRPRFCPPADPMLDSVAQHYGDRAIAVIMSGALNDGSHGALSIARAGGMVIAQDRATSMCFSMPWAAVENDSSHFVLPLPLIASALVAFTMSIGAVSWFRVHHGAPITNIARALEKGTGEFGYAAQWASYGGFT